MKPIDRKALDNAMIEITKDPVLRVIFSNWANMILNWPPRGLHGLSDIGAIEMAVCYALYEIETATNSLQGIWVDISRPIAFGFAVGETMQYRELVIKNPGVQVQ